MSLLTPVILMEVTYNTRKESIRGSMYSMIMLLLKSVILTYNDDSTTVRLYGGY